MKLKTGLLMFGAILLGCFAAAGLTAQELPAAKQLADNPNKGAVKAAPKPPATIEVPEIDSLKLRSLQLDANGRRARAEAMQAQAVLLNQQATEIERQGHEMFVKVCKALGVSPDEYDGQFNEKGLTLVRREPTAKP